MTTKPVESFFDTLESLPLVLRAYRLTHRYSQETMARKIGVSPWTVSRIERDVTSEFTNIRPLLQVMEWFGNLTAEQWQELRYADVRPPSLSSTDFLDEYLRLREAGLSLQETARKLGYTKTDSMLRRLYRLDRRDLTVGHWVSPKRRKKSETAVAVKRVSVSPAP